VSTVPQYVGEFAGQVVPVAALNPLPVPPIALNPTAKLVPTGTVKVVKF